MATIQIKAEVSGSVWKIITAVGETVEPGGTLMILESMKMEIPVLAPKKGRIAELRVSEGDSVAEGQIVLLFEPS